VNGDFELGDLSGFTSYETANGHVIEDVVAFDTNNNGVASLAAKFNVGSSSYTGSPHGGGIYQNVTLADGDLSFTVDVASTANSSNSDGGLVEAYLDGQLMASHNFGSIAGGATEYATVSFYVPNVNSGSHEIRIQLTRLYTTTSVANYIDNLSLTGSSTPQ
jgi:hypothetical protein